MGNGELRMENGELRMGYKGQYGICLFLLILHRPLKAVLLTWKTIPEDTEGYD